VSLSDQDRIQRALEGLLSAEEGEQFKRDVCADPELRADYVRALWLDAQLRADRSRLPSILEQDLPRPLPAARNDKAVQFPERRGLGWGLRWAAAVAAIAGLAFGLGKSQLLDGSVAVLVQADHCKWAGSELPTAVGSRLGPGTLSLVEGIATVRFNNGATLSLEAPTTLRVLDRMHCRLVEGSVTAEVPESAHGFTVETQDMKVIDWGTKFGVSASALGDSQVRVFEGEVEVAGTPHAAGRRLNKGQGFNLSTGTGPGDQEPLRVQTVEESGGWTSIPTSFGRGRDAYVRRGYSAVKSGAAPLLMVKHSELEASKNNERRALITFDLASVDLAPVTEARILLEPKPSGFGFPSLVPDSHFSVYGLMDESRDDWDERGMVWEDLPATSDSGPDMQAWRKVGEFGMARGASGTVTISGQKLAEFLRSKKNGLATFLILRDTGESDPSGLVHAFASREHPGATPPTLQLK
jgi:ferric-dicitrate binding protein FerR (iron transport regulator)